MAGQARLFSIVFKMYRFIRKNNRLDSFVYSQKNMFFVTLCVQNRVCLFWDVIQEKMICNSFGHIVEENRKKIPEWFEYVTLDAYVIMPNHIHGIIVFSDIPIQKNIDKKSSLWCIVSRFKNFSRKEIVQLYKSYKPCRGGPVPPWSKESWTEEVPPWTEELWSKDTSNPYSFWQKSFHDHVIQNNIDYISKQKYIQNNPAKWQEDDFYHIENY